MKLDSPKLLTLDECWWRTNVDCEKLNLDPSGCPVMRKATLKATVVFLSRVSRLLDKGEHVIDFTLPKGLCYDHCEMLGKLAHQRIKDGKLSTPLSPEMLWCMLTASLDVHCSLDHTRLNFRKEGRGLDRTVRLFITSQSFTLTEKNASSLIPRNAKVRPLPYDYDLNDVTDLWNAVQSGYDWHLSDPYLRFASGTPETHRVDFFARPNFCEWIALRITPDASTDYKEERSYSAK